VDWSNPHIHVYVAVKADQGVEESWILEFPSPGAVIVAGMSKQLLLPGSVITVETYPGKRPIRDDAPPETRQTGCAKAVTLPDGSRVTFVVGI
jgi:hypothetical protein